MKKLDYLLQRWRYSVAIPHIPSGCYLLDIGGFDGSFLSRVSRKIRHGVCIDPQLEEKSSDRMTFIRARVDRTLPFPNESFDVITMFAVFEHLGSRRQLIAAECFRVCKRNGVVVLNVPSSTVDTILAILLKAKLINGISAEEHENFDATETVGIFELAGFQLKLWSKFQFGLNNLFIFKKCEL